jgi:HK97 family phage major capsid protein
MTRVELLQKKGQLANEAKQILESAHGEGREALRKEEEDKFNAIHADIEKLTKHVQLIDRQEETERSLNDPGTRKTEPNPLDPDVYKSTSRLTQGLRDKNMAMRAWFLAGAPSNPTPIPAEYLAAAQRVGLNLSNKQLSFRLGPSALRGSGSEELTRWDRMNEEERALAGPQSTTSAGGYSIQDAAMRQVEIALLAYGGMRKVSTIIRTDTGGPLPIPTVNDTTNVGALIAEATTVGTQDFTFSQLVLDAWTYTSKSVLVSVQLMQDNSVNLGEIVGGILAERLGRITNTHFTTGTGTGQPNGVVTAATFTMATTGNSTSITLNNLLALYHSVDPSYRDNSKFMMNDNTLMKIKQMVDSQNRPLWLPGLVDRAPDTILGSPYVINQDMSSMTITGKSILFGDFSKYWIRDVRDFTLLRLDERFAEFLQVAFLAFLRTDGDLLNAGTNPIKGYQNATG